MRLRGYTPPLSISGQAGLLVPPPWHYAGDLLVLEYQGSSEAIAGVLPDSLDGDDGPLSVAAIFANWQCTSDRLEDLTDPTYSQHNEFFLLVAARHRDEPVAYCPFIWVDSDVSMLRGWIQGFPKQLGSVRLTRSLPPLGKAAAPLRPGTTFGATCGARDGAVARASARLDREGAEPSVYGRRLFLFRHFADSGGLAPTVAELVEVFAEDLRRGPAWTGSGTLTLDPVAGAEFAALGPLGDVTAHRLTVGYTVSGARPATVG